MIALRATGILLSMSASYALVVAALGGRAGLVLVALVLGGPGAVLWALAEGALRAEGRRTR